MAGTSGPWIGSANAHEIGRCAPWRVHVTPRLNCDVSESVWDALRAESERTGDSIARVVDRSLSSGLGLDRHSLFQVSTTTALVEGVFRGAVTVKDLSRHGDFGLGTYEGLDGELVMLDGVCYRAGGGGSVTVADSNWEVPFGVVTRFVPDESVVIEASESLTDLEATLDALRPSENIFVGLRVDGSFEKLVMRAACPAAPGEGLVEATSHQSEFDVRNLVGSLVGFWTPAYTKAVTVPGYHFHFIAADRSVGGHVFDLQAGGLAIGIHIESDVHIAIPQTVDYLQADLSGDTSEALRIAESARE